MGPASNYKYNKNFWGQQLRQVIEHRVDRDFNHNLCSRLQVISSLITRTNMVLKTPVFSPFNHLTQLLARGSFIVFSRPEIFRLHSVTSKQTHQFLYIQYGLIPTPASPRLSYIIRNMLSVATCSSKQNNTMFRTEL
jgi:hypothetical protein